MGQYGDSERLRVNGVLALDDNDRVVVAAYMRKFIADGLGAEVAAEAAAYEQVAQDILGGVGFAVEEAEPL